MHLSTAAVLLCPPFQLHSSCHSGFINATIAVAVFKCLRRSPDSCPAMSSIHNEGADFWGVLINADKSPTPLLEQLCLGIAQVMTSFDEFATTDLTPDRLAAFYRKVGGNYDVLFLQTRPSALSFIYQRLGCFHSIQPTNDPYKPPSIPALQPNGFVRWQTIQLLLDPDEHSRWLQNAVDLWDIETPNGGIFPKVIPRGAFPAEPDPEMVQWHEEVSRRFELDYWKKNIMRSAPPNFAPYHSYFSQKDVPTQKEDESPRSQRRTTPHRQEPTSASERRNPHKHRHRRSDEKPPSTTRRVQSTYFPRQSENLNPGYSSRPSSPPMWAKEPTKSRTRERQQAYGRSVSPGTVPGFGGSDASSEDSGSAVPEPPRSDRYSYPRNLSPPQVSHTRRHSHEAYARRPRKDLSPDPHKHPAHSDTYHSNPGRLYDSDGARRIRISKAYNDEPLQQRASGVGFRERVVSDPPPTFPPGREVPVFTRMHSRYVGAGDTYIVHPHPDLEPMSDRRNSYHRSTNANSNGNSTCTAERARYIDPRNPRWAAPVQSPSKRGVPVQPADVEYARGRRTAMYDR
ncbi:hypothetical protein BDV37DRAFT_243553 [Aspergillus pseudonomiae]|uniref:DUF7514 domain-containing protein n=1 Tax=Aspergillus pseudonomiae TaxID=1506151 RepID=A0A5N7DIK8_9EURO|nr:uncharacterized protein BDV37DRAFT_243553 [Aspergillus pseudonomiae]KAE8406267.1 hypothetical protein BDV37DRAFT_243553 [Aspergillus pseudonomiae]